MSLGLSQRRATHVAEFVRTVLTQNGIDAVQQVSGTGTEGLVVVFAIVHDLGVVHRCDLWVMQPSDLRNELPRGKPRGIRVAEVAVCGFAGIPLRNPAV